VPFFLRLVLCPPSFDLYCILLILPCTLSSYLFLVLCPSEMYILWPPPLFAVQIPCILMASNL
jgi:hypothetical protein